MVINTYVGRVRKGSALADTGITGEQRRATRGRRRPARRARRQALRPGHGAARHQPAPAQGRGARPARRQRRRQVDADQDHLAASRSPTTGRLIVKGEETSLQLGRPRAARSGSTASTRTSRWSTSCRSSTTCSSSARRSTARCRSWPTAAMSRRRGAALDEIGVNIPRLDVPGRAPVGRPAPGDRGRAHGQLRRRHHPARRAARGDGRQGGGDDPRPRRPPAGGGPGLDHHDRATTTCTC